MHIEKVVNIEEAVLQYEELKKTASVINVAEVTV